MTLINSKQLRKPITGSFTGSFFGDGSGLINISSSAIIGLNLPQITAGSVTASVSTNPTNLFSIKSSSNDYINIQQNSTTTIYSDLFIIKNFSNQQSLLTISQSIIQFATQSSIPVGNPNIGSIWFTSSSFYIALE